MKTSLETSDTQTKFDIRLLQGKTPTEKEIDSALNNLDNLDIQISDESGEETDN